MSGSPAGDVGRWRFRFSLRLPTPGPFFRLEHRGPGGLLRPDGSGESYSDVWELRLVVLVFTWSKVEAVCGAIGDPGAYGQRGRL